MTQLNETNTGLIAAIDAHQSSLEQFIINGATNLRVGLIQREALISELTAENDNLRNQLLTAEQAVTLAQAVVAERDNSLAIAAAQIAELEQRIANLNTSIDAAQGQA